MADTKISALTDGTTADATDRLPVARSPFGSGDNRFVTPSYIRTYILGLASAFSANGAVSAPVLSGTGTWYTGGTATTTKPAWLIEPSGTTSTGWSTSGTGLGINGPAAFAGNLIDLQVAGVSAFKVTSAGGVVLYNAGTPWSIGGDTTLLFSVGGTGRMGVGSTSNFRVASDYSIGWSSNTEAYTAPDTRLWRDAANTLGLRNSTSAQTFNTYGTYTDGSNYRRVTLTMTTAGVASLSASGAGTGSSGNVLHISSLPTSNPGPGILWNNAGTPAIGT